MTGVRRYRCTIILLLLVFCLGAVHGEAQQFDDFPQWTSAGDAESKSALSLFRYSSVGLGSYPYLSAAPGIPMRTTLDGVPIRAVSPFGPDLDFLPVQFADSLSYRGVREIEVKTVDITSGEPRTSTSFLLGKRRRFRVNMSFNRRIDEQSGIVVAGASSGIHGGEMLEKSISRNYFMKYNRNLPRTGALVFWANGYRDRDGLSNLVNGDHMGERRTDGLTMSGGLENYRLGASALLSSKLFYQRMNTRIGRYGSRRSLDDDTAGFRMSIRNSGDTGYYLGLFHDIRMFDSRIHDESWTRRESGIEGGLHLSAGVYSFSLNGKETWSSTYDAGLMIESEFARRMGNVNLALRVVHEDIIPDTGSEYYSALVFTDTTAVTRPETYRMNSAETAVRFGDAVDIGIFLSRYERPAFPIIMSALEGESLIDDNYLAGETDLAGMRLSFHYLNRGRFTYQVSGAGEFCRRAGDSDRELWPFPTATATLQTRISRDFIGDRLHAVWFQESRYQKYDAPRGLSPSGDYFMIDTGITIRVRTLELFYIIENLTNEDIIWFNAFAALESHGMWGGRWIFYN